jgi:hypothetical protein
MKSHIIKHKPKNNKTSPREIKKTNLTKQTDVDINLSFEAYLNLGLTFRKSYLGFL